ncbi:hypothetical protein ScPMuIL_001229 [Solemya velum]
MIVTTVPCVLQRQTRGKDDDQPASAKTPKQNQATRTKMANICTRSMMMAKLLSHTKTGKRVVSTSTSNRQGAQVMSISDVIQQECPFRTAFEKVGNVVKVPKKTESYTPATKLKSFEEVPGPKGLPVIGTLLDYFKKDGPRFNKMFEAYQNRALQYGDIYKENIATISTVVISDPDEYAKVIRAEGRYPNRREMEPLAYYRKQKGIGLGLVSSQGEEWHKYRTVTNKKMLKLKEVANYCGPMHEVATDFVQHLSNVSGPTDDVKGIQGELFKWAMESIGTFLFEQRLGCFGKSQCKETKSFINNLFGFFQTLQPLMYNVPVYKLYPTKLWKQFESYGDNVLRHGRYFVEKRMNQLQNADSDYSVEDNSSFLSYLLSHESLTTKEAVATAVDLLVGATETTTNATLWTLYCLGNNPEVQETFFEEIHRVLPNGEEISPEKLKELPYVKAILKETLRLYPITFATSRILQDDVEIAGYKVPSGSHVQANLYGMYRNPGFFPEPEKFKPERWLRETSDMTTSLKALSNLVWGHGARMCIGRRFAEQEIHLLLTKIVQKFKLQYDGEAVHPVLKTVMTPDRPVNLRFIPRHEVTS